MSDPKLVIGVAGRIGSGKTEVAHLLETSFGFQYLRYSLLLAEWFAEDATAKAKLQQLGWDVMSGDGQHELNRRLISKIDRNRECAVDGLRHPLDFQSLSAEFGTRFALLFVDTPIRIYNKTAELKRQWLRLRRNRERFNNGLQHFNLTDDQREFAPVNVPTFEEFCTFQNFSLPEGATVTRVERQITGRMPDELRSVDDLRRLPEFRPFEQFTISNSKRSRLPALSHWNGSVRDYLAVRGLQQLINDCGSLQHATSIINRYGRGNGKRILESLAPFLPSSGFNLTVHELNDTYKRSVMRQICN
jgi:hypothetical protein